MTGVVDARIVVALREGNDMFYPGDVDSRGWRGAWCRSFSFAGQHQQSCVRVQCPGRCYAELACTLRQASVQYDGGLNESALSQDLLADAVVVDPPMR